MAVMKMEYTLGKGMVKICKYFWGLRFPVVSKNIEIYER